jgi:hypothetical protein
LSALKRSKVAVSKYFVIHLNSEHVRVGEFNIEQLFKIEDVRDKVVERLPVIEAQMDVALDYLARTTERRKETGASIADSAINAQRFNIRIRTLEKELAVM